jgi:hypothetical protein
MTTTVTNELIGYVPVDSGRISVLDPCGALCLAAEFARAPLDLDNPNAYGVQTSVTVSTVYGDGWYPVYLEVGDDGLPVAIRIELAA